MATENSPENVQINTPVVDNTPDVNNNETPTDGISTENPVKKVDPFQKRIGKMHSQIKEKEAKIAELERKFEEFSKNIPVKEKEYENAESYLKDQVKQLLREEREAEKQTSRKTAENEKVMKKWNDKMTKFRDSNPDVDFSEWQISAADLAPVVNDHIGDYAHDSDVGPELINEILTNYDHIEALNDLSPRQRERYLDKLERNILDSRSTETSVDRPVNEKKERPVLDKPPTPSKGKGTSVIGKSLEELAKKSDLTEYFAMLKASKKK